MKKRSRVPGTERCLRCGHEWLPRTLWPSKKCPRCGSYKWDEPRAKTAIVAGLLMALWAIPAGAQMLPPDVARAHTWAREFRAALGATNNLWIGVAKAPLDPTRPKTIAYTTRDLDGACHLTFTHESIRERWVVAHEVFHCAADARHLGPEGYWPYVTSEMRTEMEERARRGHVWLIDDSAVGRYQRARYLYPSDWGLERPRW